MTYTEVAMKKEEASVAADFSCFLVSNFQVK
jgi:hypothetical protein